MNQPLLKLSDLLLHFRIDKMYRQTEMAKFLNCTQAQYSFWETGRSKPSKLREIEIRKILNNNL